MRLVTEYLFIIEKSSTEALYHLCSQSQDFRKLLQADNTITFEKDFLVYKNKKYAAKLKTNKVGGKDQRFFYLTLAFEGAEEEVVDFEELLRAVRTVAHRSGAIPETLWDDTSLHYSKQSYPAIHRIESLMRKLITYFMLTTIGKHWVTQASPGAFKEAVDKSKRSQYYDVLHQVDFIHLGDFLFKPYPNRDAQELISMLSRTEKVEDLSFDELQAFVAKSNWERYFSKIVDCSSDYLGKRWRSLYELRCKVAHNALVSRGDCAQIRSLASEIERHLQNAIDNIDRVHVPNAAKEQIAEGAVENLGVAYAEFIRRWREFEDILQQAYSVAGLLLSENAANTTMGMLSHFCSTGFLGADFKSAAERISAFRSRLIHGAENPPVPQEVILETSLLVELTREVYRAFRLEQSWKDELTSALQALGGEASLEDIYAHIERRGLRDLAENWQASVRYTLQRHSPNTETHKRGGEGLFCHVGRGRYALIAPK